MPSPAWDAVFAALREKNISNIAMAIADLPQEEYDQLTDLEFCELQDLVYADRTGELISQVYDQNQPEINIIKQLLQRVAEKKSDLLERRIFLLEAILATNLTLRFSDANKRDLFNEWGILERYLPNVSAEERFKRFRYAYYALIISSFFLRARFFPESIPEWWEALAWLASPWTPYLVDGQTFSHEYRQRQFDEAAITSTVLLDPLRYIRDLGVMPIIIYYNSKRLPVSEELARLLDRLSEESLLELSHQDFESLLGEVLAVLENEVEVITRNISQASLAALSAQPDAAEGSENQAGSSDLALGSHAAMLVAMGGGAGTDSSAAAVPDVSDAGMSSTSYAPVLRQRPVAGGPETREETASEEAKVSVVNNPVECSVGKGV